MVNEKTILVSGAGGFLGRNLVATLLARGYGVRAMVRRTGILGPMAGLSEVGADITRPDSLRGVVDGVDGVIHCAGLLGRWGCSDAQMEAVNVRGSVNLLEACVGARFVHISAGGVTGPTGDAVADEETPCAPATAYERSKLQAEQQILARARQLGSEALVVRPTFTYGPGDAHKLALFRAIQRRRFAFIDGGRSANTPVFITDVVDGVLAALERGRDGQVYIIGGSRPVTKRELVDTIAREMGVAAPVASMPRPLMWSAAVVLEALFRRARRAPPLTRSKVMMMADNFVYRSDRAARELGYIPQVDLAAGMVATVADYRRRGWV